MRTICGEKKITLKWALIIPEALDNLLNIDAMGMDDAYSLDNAIYSAIAIFLGETPVTKPKFKYKGNVFVVKVNADQKIDSQTFTDKPLELGVAWCRE